MKDVFDYIKAEEVNYRTTKVPVSDGYEWSMPEHIRKCTLYRDSKFTSGPDDGSRPFKNIVRRIVNLQHYATGFDVKDIEPFVDNSDKYFMSFLTRKYHRKWARKNDLDTYIDDKVESYVDFGGALSKHVNRVAPEIVPLQSIAFCDQTDILSGPICIQHQYSPAQLHEFDSKWENIDKVITLARESKTDTSLTGTTDRVVKTPGKYIEVYELDGMFPRAWLKKEGETITEADENTFTQQLHIITFYVDTKGDKHGIALYQGKGDPKKYKFIARDKIFGRALGMSAIEELFEAQVWTNYSMIRMQGMLDAASKVIHQTADTSFNSRNKLSDIENNEILVHAANMPVERLDTSPSNIAIFEKAITDWGQHAQDIGSAGDAILGVKPDAGTPFALQQLNAQQSNNLHEYRRGRLAISLGDEYRDWILPDFVKEMNNEQEFLDELSLSELQWVAEQVSEYETNQFKKRQVIAGGKLSPSILDNHKQAVKQQVMKKGPKQFFKLLKNELKGLPVDVEINIAGKQRDLAGMTDKIVDVTKMLIANPDAPKTPYIAKLLNMLIETSGMDQIDFGETAPSETAPGPKISESINFKDLPPDGQQQMAAQAGLKITPPAPLSPQQEEPALAGAV